MQELPASAAIIAAWQIGLIAAAVMAVPLPAKVLGSSAGHPAAHQSINFTSADAYVAEHAILHAREFRDIPAGAQFRLHR